MQSDELAWRRAKDGGLEADLSTTLTLAMSEPQPDGTAVQVSNLDVNSVRVRRSFWVEDGSEYGWEFSLCGIDRDTEQPAELSFHVDHLAGLVDALSAAESVRETLVRDGGMWVDGRSGPP